MDTLDISGIVRNLEFTFDTGNVKTCISKKALRDLGFDKEVETAVQKITSVSLLADESMMNNAEIVLKNVKIGNLAYDEFVFEIAADDNEDYNNLLGLDVIENFNPQLNFDDFEVTGKLREICELRTAVDFSETVRLLPIGHSGA
jgi:predicted aspartyl protease